MSLETQLQNLITAIGSTTKDIRGAINTTTGDAAATAAALNTTATTLVGAINELNTAIVGLASTDDLPEGATNLYYTDVRADARVQAAINDSGTTATDLWSALKIGTEITTAIDALVAGAPGALDTVNELAAAINDDANFATTITSSLALKANIADTKSVTELGATVDTFDYAAAWATAIS